MAAVPGTASRYIVMAGWDDVPHLDEQTKRELLAATPPHLRDARSKGIPAMGSGRIFPVDEESIKIKPFMIPDHWPRIVGYDFGWDHPAAGVWLAWDRDTDTVFIYDTYRKSEALIPVQAAAIKGKGEWIPVAWPNDGYQVKDAMHGAQLATQFRDQGVNMRPEHAHFSEAPVIGEEKKSMISTEAGIQEILTRMETGKFKVFSHLDDWWEEFRMYHRKDGLIVKLRDDLMSATRIGIMDLRHAIVRPRKDQGIDHNAKRDWFIG